MKISDIIKELFFIPDIHNYHLAIKLGNGWQWSEIPLDKGLNILRDISDLDVLHYYYKNKGELW